MEISTLGDVIEETLLPGDREKPPLCYRLYRGRTEEGRPSFSISCEATAKGVLWEDGILVRDVTSDRAAAEKIFHALTAGEVTPYGMKDVLEDLL